MWWGHWREVARTCARREAVLTLQLREGVRGEEGIGVEDWIASIRVLAAMAEWERRELPVAAGARADSRRGLQRRGRQRQPGVVHVLTPHEPCPLDQYAQRRTTRKRKAPGSRTAEVRDDGGRCVRTKRPRRAARLNDICVVTRDSDDPGAGDLECRVTHSDSHRRHTCVQAPSPEEVRMERLHDDPAAAAGDEASQLVHALTKEVEVIATLSPLHE